MREPPVMMNPYLRLGVHRGTPHEDTRKLAAAALRAAHPDKGGDQAKFQLLEEARETLFSAPKLLQLLRRAHLTAPSCNHCDSGGYTVRMQGFNHRVLERCAHCNGLGYLVRDSAWEGLT
jgi:DnaJ-class molecular chaperone